MKKLLNIFLFLMFAANLAAQENYVIDSVCVGADRYYRVDGEKGSTYEWIIKDTLGNEISNQPYTDFIAVISPGDTTWGSEINFIWSDVGIFEMLILQYSEFGCDTMMQSRVKVFDLPEAYAGPDIIACTNEIIILSNDTAWNYSSLEWTSTGDGIFDFTDKLHPIYFSGTNDSINGLVILIITANGLAENETCTPAVDSVEVIFSNPIITFQASDLLCYNDSSGTIKVDVLKGTAPYDFAWSGPNGYMAVGDSIFGLVAGEYSVSVTDAKGCIVVDSVEIFQPQQLLADIYVDATEMCEKDTIYFTGMAIGGTGKYTHLWMGDGVVNLNAADIKTPFFTGGAAGTWTVIYLVTDENGCSAFDTINVEVLPTVIPLLAEIDTLCEFDIAPMLLPVDLNGIFGTWSPDTIMTDVTGTVEYIFTPDSSYICFVTDTISVTVVPKIFPVLAEIDTLCQFNIPPSLMPQVLNGITGTWLPDTIMTDILGAFDYIFTPDSSYICFVSDTVTVVVIPSVVPVLAEIDTLCIFSVAPQLPATDLNGVIGTWSPDTIMTDYEGTFRFIFTPDSSYRCFVKDTISVLVLPIVVPLLAEADTLCELSVAPPLPSTDLNGITGYWSPDTIITSVPGTYDFIFTPDSSYVCFVDDTMSVVILPNVIPLLAEIDTLCEFSIPPSLPLTDINGITGTWSPDTISTNVAGIYEYVFTPDSFYICFVTDTVSVVVIPSVIPELAEIDTLCEFDIAPVLLPVDLNGITGTWLPDTIMTDVTGTFEFIFTPDSSYICFVSDTISVTVMPQIIPLLAVIDTLCEFSIPPSLPLTDLNGITGTWLPDTIMTNIPGTFDYIFAPDSSYICFESDTISIVIMPSIVPIVAEVDTLCAFSIPPQLPPVDLNGIAGTWSPDTIDTKYIGTFRFIFTPDPTYVCFVKDTISVVVLPPVVAEVLPMGPFCQYEIAPLLPAKDVNGVSGTWLPATIATDNTGTYQYVFTPDSVYKCFDADTISIEIITPLIADVSPIGPFCQFEIAPSLPEKDLNDVSGTWFPDTILTNVIGTFDYVFTPDSVYGCFKTDTISVVIMPSIVPIIAEVDTLCAFSIPPPLPPVDLNGIAGTWSPDTIDTKYVGTFRFIFTPDSSYQCFVKDTISVVVIPPVIADATPMGPFCQYEIAPLLPSKDVNGVTGTWLPQTIVTDFTGSYKYVFTPDSAYRCFENDTISIEIVTPFIANVSPIGPFCQFDKAPLLPYKDLNDLSGTWFPDTIMTNVVGIFDFVFTPDSIYGCIVKDTISIIVMKPFEADHLPIGPICQDEIAPLLPSTDINGISGTWSPDKIKTDVAGFFDFVFTPDSSYGCFVPDTMTIEIRGIESVSDISVCMGSPSFDWNGQIISTDHDSTYVATLINTLGCDSIATLNVTVLPAFLIFADTTICESDLPYQWYGNDYASEGIYTLSLPSAAGCDTILTLDLKITIENTPLFVQIGPFNLNSVAPALPLVSANGIKGTWNPAIVETSVVGTTTFTFIPDIGECAVEYPMDITVGAVEYSMDCPPDTLFDCDSEFELYAVFNKYIDFVSGGGKAFSDCGLDLSTFGLNTEFDDRNKCPRTITRTYEITDSCGNYMYCSQTIVVHDKIPPIVICPPALSVACITEIPPAYKDFGSFVAAGGNASDNCGIIDLTSFSLVRADTIIALNQKEVIRRYSIKDMCGNESYCDQSIIYLDGLIIPVFIDIGPYCQYSWAPALPKISDNGITGTWIPNTINTNIVETAYYWFIPDEGQCAVETLIGIEIYSPAVPVFDQIGPLCHYSIAPPLPTVSNDGIRGGWSQTEINTSFTGIQLITFTPFPGQCAASTSMEIAVVNEIIPLFDPLGPFCQNTVAPALPAVSKDGITGTWNPSTIITSVVGKTPYTFTPGDDQCAVVTSIIIEVVDETIPIFAHLGPLCQNSIAPALSSISENGITGSWSPSTINTSATGINQYVFTPDNDQCAVLVIMDIEIIPPIMPAFAAIWPLCQNSIAPLLPLVSENGITGTWTPGSILTATLGETVYTFTPDAGQCATEATLIIEITDEIKTIFTDLGPFCLNTATPVLPSVSNNGITGTWNPATIDASAIGITNYTFSPDPGQCALDTTISIEITNKIDPLFAAIGPFCQNSVAPALPLISQNGISGTWTPALIDTKNAGALNYTFTPDSGQCAAIFTTSILVTPEITPLFAQLGPLCQNGPAPALLSVSGNGISGTWNPAVIDTKDTGTFTFAFTPAVGQCAVPLTMDIEVRPLIKPVFMQLGPLCQNGPAPALPAVSTNGISGVWKPAVIDTKIEGTFMYIFTPAAGECAIKDTMTIEITPEIKPVFAQIGPLCQNSAAPFLPAISTNGINGTWNPATIDTKVQGTFTYTFTPAAVQCAVPFTMTILVTPEITPAFKAFSPVCPDIVAPVLPMVSTNGINGTWDPAIIETSAQGIFTFTFTPDSGQCAVKTTMKIEISDIIPPVAICRNITVYLDNDGKASITAAQIDKGSSDNCTLDTLYLSRYDFDCADIGKNPVTFTAVDGVGLFESCEATVTVLDTVSPVVLCRGPFEIQLDENAEYKLTVVEVLDSVYDNCGEFDTIYVYPHELDCDHIGLTTITLMVTDVNGNSSYCETEVMVYGNRPPTVVDDSTTTLENIPVVFDVIDNDYDEKTNIDISTLAISIKPLHGKVTINPVNGDFTYTPNYNFSGVDVLQYRICDDGIPCEPECGTAYVYITVQPINDKPVAVDDYYNAGCFSVTRNVTDNDRDPDSDNLTMDTNPLFPPNHGELIIDLDGTISYFPNEGFVGIDSFSYIIWDSGIPSLSDTATVYIEVDCNEETQNKLDCELFIPEGFSPNEDAVHDFFRIMCIHNYPSAKLMIFNRNGDLLWEKEHYGNYEVWGDQYNAWWWGTSVLSKNDVGMQTINGDPRLKPGNYVYVLLMGNGEVKNGTVMISY